MFLRTYVIRREYQGILKKNFSYNKYTQIAARALRQSLKEEQRLVAEKRGLTALRYQHWEDGKGGEQVSDLYVSQGMNVKVYV